MESRVCILLRPYLSLLIFIPDDEIMESDDLKNMVMEVNRTQVQEQEFLSDEVYYYDYKNKDLYILNK